MQHKITVHVCVDLITTTLCRLAAVLMYTHMYQGLEWGGGPDPTFLLLFHENLATSLVSKKNK